MPTVDYQNPSTPGVDFDPLVARLRNQAQQAGGGGVLFIAGGVGISLFMMLWPAGIIAWLTGGYLNFWLCYFIAILSLVPFILIKLRDSNLPYESENVLEGVSRPSSYGEYQMVSAKFELSMIIGWIMFGPHLIVEGIKQAQGIESLADSKKLGRCALLLRDLASVGVAVQVNSLVKENETKADVDRLIKYLDRYDWVGASSDFKRAWLSSKALADLPGLGVPIRRV